MADPRHEPEVARAKVREMVDDVGATLRKLGFTAEEVAGIARAAEVDATEYAGLSPRAPGFWIA